MELARDNHFVPQAYLRRWADHDARVWTYSTLVPHDDAPRWKLKAVKGVAYRRDLYTQLVGGQDTDEFEKWIEADFETPGLRAIDRAVEGQILRRRDWEALALYFAAQCVRTPQSYVESTLRWQRELPELVESSVERVLAELEKAHETGRPIRQKQPAPDHFKRAFRVEVDPNADPERGLGAVKVEATIGRSLWLSQQRHLLDGVASRLIRHKWGIVEAADGHEWFTSDDPAVRLNYTSRTQYDFGGGWDLKKGNLLLPLSPKHLLFCQMGDELPPRFRFSGSDTRLIQRIIAERAHRQIFAARKMRSVAKVRPSRVDEAAFKAEVGEWAAWHGKQRAAEENP